MLALAKLEVLEPFFVLGPAALTDEDRAECLAAYADHLLAVARR